ncbi:hypothetical protein [Nonomuraea sp. NPDC049709]|uniref:sensor histidine kinase n=1 Tax=Nonomuraea sp. NPDC049709 TaxID=3154736 RepID=UPI00341BF387
MLVMILAGIIALPLGYVVADQALRPLDRVTETARRLSGSTMHEPRTPPAVNRTVLEEPAASEDMKALARALLGGNARYERLIEGLLLLAQSEQQLAARKTVDLEQVVRTVLEQTDLRSRRRPVTLHQDLRPVLVQGDPLFLERCLFNPAGERDQVQRAGRCGPAHPEEGARGRLDRRGEHRAAGAAVRGGGPVRAAQPDAGRPGALLQGAGLGPSIVRAIVAAHGGRVTASARPEGGLRVEVRLPRTPP